MNRTVLFIFPYPLGKSPSQRFRFEQYLDQLKASGWAVDLLPFWDDAAWHSLYDRGKYGQKLKGVLQGFAGRVLMLFRASRYRLIFIHREALPVGPPVIEWILSAVLKKKIIYDFDDAIWLPNTSEENRVGAFLKWHSKVSSICRWSYKISCGNSYLADFARQFNPAVTINPTTIDTADWHNPSLHSIVRSTDTLTIGWTGTHSTLKYLSAVTPVIHRLQAQYPRVRFLVIANKKPSLNLTSLDYIRWSREHEVEDLLQIDIGIMPLTDDPWAKGKCGFKALQYMALEIPTLASPVGVNTEIIDHGTDGFLCDTEESWFQTLSELIERPDLRRHIGARGRSKIMDRYSVSSNTSTFLSLFE